jgi:hypothetical protein
MICPNCNTEATMTTLARLMVDTDERSKNFSAWLRCQKCGACYYGATEEYWFDDDFIFSLYEVQEVAGWEKTLADALRCPQKDDPNCQCTAHTHPSERKGKLIRWQPTYYLDYK